MSPPMGMRTLKDSGSSLPLLEVFLELKPTKTKNYARNACLFLDPTEHHGLQSLGHAEILDFQEHKAEPSQLPIHAAILILPCLPTDFYMLSSTCLCGAIEPGAIAFPPNFAV